MSVRAAETADGEACPPCAIATTVALGVPGSLVGEGPHATLEAPLTIRTIRAGSSRGRRR
jgi:hypothetical protein